MSREQLIPRAVETAVEVVGGIRPDRLGEPTPCSEYDVRGLVHHLLFWGPSLEGAARKESVPPPAAAESDLDLVADGWAADLTAQLRRTADAWSEPGAWTGTTRMGGPTEMPAEVVGGMVLGEVVVHTWDLAQATGQHPVWDEDLLDHVHRDLVPTAQVGRDMGVYGPEVPVPADAPLIHRVLGLTGRQP